MSNLHSKLIDYFSRLGTGLMKRTPNLTRSTLDRLLEQNPNIFDKIVPQGRDRQTSLYTKQYFEEHLLPKRLEEAILNNVPVSYALIDIDDLKKINDKYGHEGGDAAIKYITDILNSSFRKERRRKNKIYPKLYDFIRKRREKKQDRRNKGNYNDLTARIDEPEVISDTGRVGYGDEFGVLLYGCSYAQAIKIMERLVDNVKDRKVNFSDKEIPITVSIGVAEYDSEFDSKELIKRADNALYKVKGSGKNGVNLFQ